MAEFFIEIGTEEIPSGYNATARSAMAKSLSEWLEKNHIQAGTPQTFGTPRRLTLCIPDIASMQEDVVEVHKGPNVKAAYDKEGQPTKAALGFARGKGLDVSDLEQEDTPKGKVLCARIEKKGQPTSDLLNAFLPEWVLSIPFPKKMRWGSHAKGFVRPIHWIAALFDGAPLQFEVEAVSAGNTSRGHRFLNSETFSFTNLNTYLEQCQIHDVVVDPSVRREIIQNRVEALAKDAGGFVKEDPGLLDTVTNLVEFPVPLLGEFDARYLELPVELLEITMKYHQKYFPVWKEEGKLLPHFITVSNIPAGADSPVIHGNQRVLKARLEDARFFYEEDQKKKLADFLPALKGVVFQKDLGTLHEKVERTRRLLDSLKDFMPVGPEFLNKAQRATELCKADLNTQMVFEFPELQGIIGGYYAKSSGEDQEVAIAIKEHYQPAFAGDRVPSTDIGAFVALVDKLDTIVACIGVGLIPTGSEDPYALRRHAMGIIQILIEKDIPLAIGHMVQIGIDQLGDKAKLKPDEIRQHVLDLFRQRLKTLLSGEGYEYDVIDAVLATPILSFKDVQAKTSALSALKQESYFESLATAFRRVVSILDGQRFEGLDASFLQEQAEKELFNKLNSIQQDVQNSVAAQEYSQALSLIVTIKPEVDAFFDGVMVNAEDTAIRNNRKALLSNIAELFSQIADFSKIIVKKS